MRCTARTAARVQPAKLVRGLAAAVRAARRGDLEQNRGTEIAPAGRSPPQRGTVARRSSCAASRASPPSIRGQRRSWLPMNSSMIVTEPLPEAVWAEIGWAGRRAARRRRPRLHVRPAHRRRPDRARRSRHPLPATAPAPTTDGVTQRRTVDALTALLHGCFPPPPGARSRTPGPASSACRATGARASPWTRDRARLGRRLRRQRADHDQPRRPDPAPTWSWAATPN